MRSTARSAARSEAAVARGARLPAELRLAGNVRELENVIERALVLGASDDICRRPARDLLERDPAPGMGEARYPVP